LPEGSAAQVPNIPKGKKKEEEKMKLRKSRATLGVFLCVLAAFILVAGSGMKAEAAEKIPYPVKTVKLITHSSPGGGSDVILREMAKYLGTIIDANFVVDNVRGGSGAKAMAVLANSPVDGSIFYATTPTCIQIPMLAEVEYTIDDLEPVVNTFFDPMVMYAKANSPLNNLNDLITLAKEKPGETRWGGGNPSALERQIIERLRTDADVQVRVVAFEGGGDLMLAVLSGVVDVGFGEPAEILGQVEAGKIKILTTFTDERVRKFPDVPTAVEQGYDIVLPKFRGLAGPKGLSEEVVAAWEEAIPRLLEDPEFSAWYDENCLIPRYMDQETTQAFIKKSQEEYREYLTSIGLIK
jgi:tripartite-type tricarboxylate transporter receptor subunit TctC